MKHLLLPVATGLLTLPCLAQNIPVPLNYNFNGIVHTGEDYLPDDPNGFRSISDRALDFTAGIPADPLLAAYQLVDLPGVLDIVHLGNRNTVGGSSRPFDLVVDGDGYGIQPTWLPNVDQSGPQVTVLASPLPIAPTTKVAFLFNISNGGGAFDVTFDFASGGSHTATLSGNDWFGGPLPGCDGFDNGNHPANNLSVTEQKVDMAAFAGELVTQITFGNRSNTNGGYAIYACNFEYPPEPSRVNHIALNYNYNGIVHATEQGLPDDLNGYRSISDRGLDFTAGVPGDPMLAPYAFQMQPFALDIVHLGNRNTVSGGNKPFDLVVDGDNVGVQPAWLPNVDQTGPQTTTLAATEQILLDVTSQASLLFQISNGGGSFDIEFAFATGTPLVVTVNGGDWWGGNLPGTNNIDSPLSEHNLSLTERTIDLSAQAGRVLTAISFQNRTNVNAGYAIAAMNVSGCVYCVNGSTHAITNLGGSSGNPNSGNNFSTSSGGLGCDLNWNLSGGAPLSVGLLALGFTPVSVPLGVVFPGCPGTITSSGDALVTVLTDAVGAAAFELPMPANQMFCGASFIGQFAMLQAGPCLLNLSDGVQITVGN